MNEALKNIQFIAKAFHYLNDLSTRRYNTRWVEQKNELTEERKIRYRFVYEQRKAGKIFRVIGVELGVSPQQAAQLYAKAEQLHEKGFLYSTGLGDPRYAHPQPA